MYTSINIVSFNARGLADRVKMRELFNWLDMRGAKMIFLQKKPHFTVERNIMENTLVWASIYVPWDQ